jgi:V/A-type H+-transporting ATPase subunit C
LSKKVKDDKFICVSAILRAKEAKLLTKEKLERILAEPTFEDAARMVAEAGYEDMSGMNSRQINDALARHLSDELNEIRALVPDESLLDLCRMKYGYHNAKVLVKSKGDINANAHLFSDAGRYSIEHLKQVYDSDEGNFPLPPVYAGAIREAKQALARTNNPMLADFILDKAYFSELTREAQKCGKPFLVDYVKILIDNANLRSTLRTMYMDKRGELLQYALISGGTIEIDEILNSMETKDDLVRLYSSTIFAKAAEAPDMTSFELAADNAINDFVTRGAYIAFGPTVALEYAIALENEIMSLRIVLTGKLLGMEQSKIRERLRDSCV